MASSSWDWTAQRRARFYVRQAIRHLPHVYLPVSRRRPRPHMHLNGARMAHTGVLRHGTQIVIEGYPRCGNTFAAVAFQLSQDAPLEAAHHLHAEAQIIGAAWAGVPTIVLVRDPLEAGRPAPEPDRTVGRPSSQRQSGKVTLRAELHAHKNRDLREEAYRLYNVLTEGQTFGAPASHAHPVAAS